MRDNGYQPVSMIAPRNPYLDPYANPKKSHKKLILIIIGAVIFLGLVIAAIVLAGSVGSGGGGDEEAYVPEEDTDETWKDDQLNPRLAELIKSAKHADYQTNNQQVDLSNTGVYRSLWNIAEAGMLKGDIIKDRFDKIWSLKVMNSNIINYYLDHNYLVVISGTGDFPFYDRGNTIVIYGAFYEDRYYYAFAYDSVGGEYGVYDTILPSKDLFDALKDNEMFYIIKDSDE